MQLLPTGVASTVD